MQIILVRYKKCGRQGIPLPANRLPAEFAANQSCHYGVVISWFPLSHRFGKGSVSFSHSRRKAHREHRATHDDEESCCGRFIQHVRPPCPPACSVRRTEDSHEPTSLSTLPVLSAWGTAFLPHEQSRVRSSSLPSNPSFSSRLISICHASLILLYYIKFESYCQIIPEYNVKKPLAI